MSEVFIDLESGDIVEKAPIDTTKVPGDETRVDDNEAVSTDESDSTSSDDVLHHDDDDSDDNDDDIVPTTDAERDAIRERRRQERQRRKKAQREREDSLRRELAARDERLRQVQERLDAIERQGVGSEVAKLRQAKQQAGQAYQFFKDQIRQATEAGNGAQVADATEKLLQIQNRVAELDRYEKALQQQQTRPQPLDPRLVNNAQSWMKTNKWYDPTGRDQDSRIVMSIDNALAQEGWDPSTKEYWEELSARVKKYLPHRAGGRKMTSAAPKAVVPGSSRASAAGSKATYSLSPERVQALKDAGMWDDPKKRLEMIKEYQEFDKQTQG